MYTLYMHRTPSNKVYVGITCKTTTKRWHTDGGGYKNNRHFWNAIQKYGWENIEHNILARGLTKQKACELEKLVIAFFNSNNPQHGYNHSTGGENSAEGFKHTEEARRKISENLKGKKHSEESVQRMRKALYKKVLCKETGEIYESGIEASQELGCSRALVSMVCNGKKPSVNGLHLEYIGA